MEKICSKCGELKEYEYFSKDKRNKEGITNVCNACIILIRAKYRKTRKGLVGTIYLAQLGSSRRRNHPMPTYSLNELKKWVFSQTNFESIYNNWQNDNYSSNLRPSLDRIDDYKGYSFDNIQLITWRENNQKRHADVRNGVNNKQNTAIIQLSAGGDFIKEYYSMRSCSRELKIGISSLGRICKGTRKTAKGFTFRYKIENDINP